MRSTERRRDIANILLSEKKAVSGGELSKRFGVSRQIIVGDIAALRSAGYEVVSTHSGYVLHSSPLVEREFKVKHTPEETEEELALIVGLGGMVVDVFVWHKVYGKIKADLNIFSTTQVKQFLESVRTEKATGLMNITGGYHYHTVRAATEEVLDEIGKALEENGYIVAES